MFEGKKDDAVTDDASSSRPCRQSRAQAELLSLLPAALLGPRRLHLGKTSNPSSCPKFFIAFLPH